MQRFDARLVNDACGNKDVLMKEAFDGLFVRYEDVEAELATLRSENERLKAKVSDEEWNSIWHSSARDFADKLIERRTQATQKG